MKTLPLVLALLLVLGNVAARGQHLVPSRLNPLLSTAREEAFTPWSTPEESGANWHKLSKDHVPVLFERKAGDLSRDLYVPNPGIGYWVLGNLSEEKLWRIHAEKRRIGDELVSASTYQDERGALVHWALWAPRGQSHLLKAQMAKLGITPAKVLNDPSDPFSGRMVFHRQDGHLTYELTITNGQVTGTQRMRGSDKPIATVVGGWLDLPGGRLSLLLQGSDRVDAKWRAQAQHFRVDLATREVTLEHMLYGYGLTKKDLPGSTVHPLDVLERLENLLQ